jgi:3-oxoacyl-[acyl-carrier-protein] synthase II
MYEREVVITGAGLITPLGINCEENWKNLKEMKTGIAHYPADGLPNFLQYLGKVRDIAIPEDIPQKLLGQMKFLNRGALLGFFAAREAFAHSDIPISDIPPGRRAFYLASGDFTKVGYDFMFPALKDATGGTWQNIDFQKLNTSALNKVNPFFLLESLSNNLFSFLSAFFELMGPNTSLASLSPCGGYALELAARSIKHDKADMALAVGCGNWITEIPLYELESLGIISKCTSGIHSFRPFNRQRDGFIPGEGGAALLLEAAESAHQRGATILGRIKGLANYSEFSDNAGFSVPAKVCQRSIELALRDAQCEIKDLASINPHGSGTQQGDRSEMRSIVDVFNAKHCDVPICGMKPYTGHLGAASDIAEVIFGIKGVQDNMVPATLNFEETEKDFSDLKISNMHQACEKRSFLSMIYGIGGQSLTMVVEGT